MMVDEPYSLAVNEADNQVCSHVGWRLGGVGFWVDSDPGMSPSSEISDTTDFLSIGDVVDISLWVPRNVE